MELKTVSVPIYKDASGVPAYKSGEWPGIKPNHFGRTRLILNQIRKNNYSERKSTSRYIPEKKSLEYVFRPSLKLVKSYIDNLKKEKREDRGRKHNIESYTRISDTYDNNIFFGHKKIKDKILYNKKLLPKIKENQKEKEKLRLKFLLRSLSEHDVEHLMNRKKRIKSLRQQRNNYRIGNNGDKTYKYVEYSPDFFKERGLIPGSTNTVKISEDLNKLKNDIYKHMNLNVKSLDVEKIWDNKIYREEKINDMKYVLKLEFWDKKLNKLCQNNNNDKNNNN